MAEASGADFHSADNDEVISRPEVTAVFVSTPEGEHAAPVCKALELGKPVLVEKPLALSLNDAEAILATLKRTGGTCASATAAASRNASCAPRSRCCTAGSAR